MATLQDYLGITKLRDAWPKWKANVIAINNQVINHVAGSADKHSAQEITYTGDFAGKTEVKAALDQAKTEIDTIVVNASIDPEVAFARDSAVKSKVFGSLDDRLEEDEQDLVSYKADNVQQSLNPLTYDTINEAIIDANTTKTKLVCNKIILTANTSFRGVELDVTEIDINGFDLELGGISNTNGIAVFSTSPKQSIQRIIDAEGTGNVYIRSAMGQHIYIGFYNADVKLRMNETLTAIAYNTFTFESVKSVSINNDDDVPAIPSKTLWCNENIFNLNQCNHFSFDGTFPHDMNRIYGGTFEGNSTLDFNVGYNNIFYNMRFEGKSVGDPTRGTIVVTFSDKTISNIVYKDLSGSPIDIIDNGLRNQVITTNINNSRLLNNYSIKVDTFNGTYMNGFKNIELTTDTLGLKPTSYVNTTMMFESEFFDNPKDLSVTLNVTRKQGNGLYMKYRVYDEDFVDVSDNWKSGGAVDTKSFYTCNTNESKLTALDMDGRYTPPLSTIYNDVSPDTLIFNDVYFIKPTTHWMSYKPYITEVIKEIKYVKFFIFPQGTWDDTAEFYDMRISFYDIAGNYRVRYFTN